MLLAGISMPAFTQAVSFTHVGVAHEISGSLQMKSGEPTTGFGASYNLVYGMAFANSYGRVEGSYFSGEDRTYFDVGAAMLMGYPMLNVIEPYAGVTLGINNSGFKKFVGDVVESDAGEDPDVSLMYGGIAGIRLTSIPFIKPFAEFKMTTAQQIEPDDDTFITRIAVGVAIRF